MAGRSRYSILRSPVSSRASPRSNCRLDIEMRSGTTADDHSEYAFDALTELACVPKRIRLRIVPNHWQSLAGKVFPRSPLARCPSRHNVEFVDLRIDPPPTPNMSRPPWRTPHPCPVASISVCASRTSRANVVSATIWRSLKSLPHIDPNRIRAPACIADGMPVAHPESRADPQSIRVQVSANLTARIEHSRYRCSVGGPILFSALTF